MLAKMLGLILGVGATAAALLAVRQAQVQAARELAEARLRVRAIDERVGRLRAEIARTIRPESLASMMDEAGSMRPVARTGQDRFGLVQSNRE
ncbi:MAG: hypothetical protein IT439_06845 [Phycisphaerales bacterium]|nr:hypothetical protein [Phycisphaerales bacterium]